MSGDGMGRFVRDTARVLGGQIVMTAVGMGTGIITARWLGPEGRGLFQLVVVVAPFMIANLIKLGVPQASVYAIKRERVSASVVASNAVCLALSLGVLAAVGCWLARDAMLTHLLKGGSPAMLAAVVVLIVVVILQAYLLGIVQALQRFGEYNLQQIVPNVLSLVGMAVVLIWMDGGVAGAVAVYTVVMVVVTVWLGIRVDRVTPIRPRVDVGVLRGMLRFGAKSHVQTLAATWHLRADQALLGYLLGPTQVGLYAVAVNLTNLLLRIPDALGTVLFPRLAGAASGAREEATMMACRWTFTAMSVGALVYVMAGPTMLRLLFGERFAASVAPMMILLPGVVVMGQYLILSRYFTSRSRQAVNIAAAVTALTVNVGLNLFCIPRWGIAGAAAASVGSYGLAALVLMVMFVRETGCSVWALLLLGGDDIERMRSFMR